jgi:competence protein ComEA
MFMFRLFLSIFLVCCFACASSAYAAEQQKSNVNTAASQKLTQPVNINTADAATLKTLKGIGDKKAQAIIDYRNKNGAFKSVDDLTKVKGISAKVLAKLQQNNPGRIIVKPIV